MSRIALKTVGIGRALARRAKAPRPPAIFIFSSFDIPRFPNNLNSAFRVPIMTSKILRSSILLSCLLLLSACVNHKGGAGGDAGAYGGGSDSDTVGGTPLPERQDGVSFMGDNVDKTKFPPVHFAFDSYAIDPADQGTLDSVASFLQSAPNTIIIAGFTDERGTPEYNRGLGESRAEAVRAYLLQHGADNGKIQTVSFGAEMPVDPDSSEDAWAKNRRAEFGVVK